MNEVFEKLLCVGVFERDGDKNVFVCFSWVLVDIFVKYWVFGGGFGLVMVVIVLL